MFEAVGKSWEEHGGELNGSRFFEIPYRQLLYYVQWPTLIDGKFSVLAF